MDHQPLLHAKQTRIILITGPSGAGRTTAIHALQDAGFEAIDNIPLKLIPRLLDGPAHDTPLVLGIDTRNRDFSISLLIETIDDLSRTPRVALQVVYLDCQIDALANRYSSTRRRHPMAPEDTPVAGIRRELELFAPIQARADILIDTTHLSPHELKAEVDRWFAPDRENRLAITLHSFSYKRGTPRGVDVMFDCRFLRNPFWDEHLRRKNGTDPAVQDYIAQDQRFDTFLKQVGDMATLIIPAHAEEGRTHLSIGFGCSGGRHRSVTMAEILFKRLASTNWHVTVRHRELERWPNQGGQPQQKVGTV
ncbi:MAG: RNase adapter RapZ [Pseudomonadota bacterium]